MPYGVDDTGFTLKRLLDIKTDIAARLNAVQDPVSGEYLTVDLADENDPIVQIVNAVSDEISDAWENLQEAYNQGDPQKASGAGLSGIVQLNGIRRRAGTNSTVLVTLTGTPGLSIEAGKLASDLSGESVFVLPAATIGDDGTVIVQATAQEEGAVSALAGTIVKIVTPVGGLTSVNNEVDATVGTDEETDSELFVRQQASTSLTGRSTIEDLYSALSQLTGVTFVKVYQNRSQDEDVTTGIPGKAVAVVISGGDEDDIADTIFQHLGLGVDTFGNVSRSYLDTQGISYPVLFSRPTEIPIYVSIEIQVIRENVWPDNGIDLIKAAIISYTQSGAGSLNIESGFDREGFLPGENIIASELYTPTNSQPGIKINSILVGTSDPADVEEIEIDWNEIGSFSSTNIDITIVEES